MYTYSAFTSSFILFLVGRILVEINLGKTRWLICGSYHPPSQNDKYFFDFLGIALDIYSDRYDKFLLTGYFNAQVDEPDIDSFQHTKVISSGLSDCHKMVVTVLKTTIQKSKPREIIYRDYSKFNQKTFRENLKESFMAKSTNNYDEFEGIFLSVPMHLSRKTLLEQPICHI